MSFAATTMGNMLESDSSNASDGENGTQGGEMRTDGDGMESDVIQSPIKTLGAAESFPLSLPVSELVVSSFSDHANLEAINLKQSSPVIYENTNSKTRKINSTIISPRELPSRDKLIPLKPMKSKEESGNSVSSLPNASYVQFTAAPLGKQKNPKFIPYEPYSGATRSMIDDDMNTSRRPSSSCSSSNSKVGTKAENLRNVVTNRSLENTPTKSKGNVSGELSNSTAHHSTTLLKERLKISEKEIQELQIENVRLKRMLVDSLSGAGSSEAKMTSLSLNCKSDSSGNTHSITESFDNLNDEIEVWRSKFLSSCVLVDQLTKENQNVKEMVVNAISIFREIKNTTSLTPELFEQLNQWLAHSSSIPVYQGYDESLDTEEENSTSV